MGARHGMTVRGLDAVKGSPLYQGHFGRMFRDLPAAQFGADEAESLRNLAKLGVAMAAKFDPPKDGKDDEESGIPALYTYFGQFVDHDVTFDPASSLQKQNDPDALVDFRTPAFDLDSVYGRGPDDQPYMYNGRGLLLGRAVGGGSDVNATDLPRNGATPAVALIGDPRNDENAIITQLHGLFLRFHNRMVAENPQLSFAEVQQLVRFHYQYIIINDFLPRIVNPVTLECLKTGGRYDATKLRFFHWRHEPFMPVEFSVAAYRLGHSMVRPGYHLNDHPETLLPIFPVMAHNLNVGLTGFRALNQAWGLDWGRFIDIDQRLYDGDQQAQERRLQFAYKLDTSLVDPLANLPTEIAPHGPRSLAERNLQRGWRLGLPSGQSVAKAMGVPPLKDGAIRFVTEGGSSDILTATKSTVFAGNCPLWTYILAEAAQHVDERAAPVTEKVVLKTPQLGPVGGRIVAEVFLGLLFGDGTSLLRRAPHWTPAAGEGYALKDFVLFALGA
jgi:hypothetical protein